MINPKLLPSAISFSGCGFLGLYHVGVIKSLQTHGAYVLENLNKFGGASAGSLAAAILGICPEKVPQCKKIAYDLAETVRKLKFGAFTSGFRLSTHVEKMVDSVLPANAHEVANGRVFISVTRKSCGKNFVISHFKSRADLINCLVSSCHIPVYSGKDYPVFRDEKYYDGGFTDNLIDFPGEETLPVTPFSGGLSYLCPSDPISKWNVTCVNQNFCVNALNVKRGIDAMFPPPKQELDRYYDQGFVDGLKYLVKMSELHPEVFTLSAESITPRNRERLLAYALKPRIKTAAKKGDEESLK